MLIKCPECELQVSDKAISCPHCGYPMKISAKKRQTKRRRRLPNGFGQISEIKGRNLRKPFRAMVTVGKDEHGKPIVKPLKPQTYFKTYNDAYAALVEYNRNPYDLSPAITVKELYEKWSKQHFKTLSDSGVNNFTSAWRYCTPVYDMPVTDLRPRHIKACMTNKILVRGRPKAPSQNSKDRIKSLFNLMLDYAIEYDIVDKNYSRLFSALPKRESAKTDAHKPFTDEEMQILWENASFPFVDILLFQCYSGWRPGELSKMLLTDVDLKQNIIVSGQKTEAGINRTVPIHSKVQSIIEKHYNYAKDLGSKYLFNIDGGDLSSYHRYSNYFTKIRNILRLAPDHKPHDGRKHFVTKAKEYKVDEYAIKRIIGHKIDDITEAIYTERSIDWLREEIEKIR